MTTLTQPLKDEHKELYPHIESLKLAGISVHGTLSQASLDLIDEAYEFLSTHLLPHAQAEEAALYPVVQKVMGSPYATATMSRDHVEVERLTRELAAAPPVRAATRHTPTRRGGPSTSLSQICIFRSRTPS